MNETQKRLRGHRFTPTKAVLDKIPALYATEGQDFEQKTIHAHFFSAGSDYYVAELGVEEDGSMTAFGYVQHAAYPDGAEWGYFSLDELEQVHGRTPQGLPVIIERDMHWSPQPFSQVTGVDHREPVEETSQQAPESDSSRPTLSRHWDAPRQQETDPAAQADTGEEPDARLLDVEGLTEEPDPYGHQAEDEADPEAGEPEGEPSVWIREGFSLRDGAESGPELECPECSEDAVAVPPVEQVPWDAYGLQRPEHSHRDGSSLCPVLGSSGGYEPAQPSERVREADADVARLDPPKTLVTEATWTPEREGPLYDSEGQIIPDDPQPAGHQQAPVPLEPGTADYAFGHGWSPDGGRHGLFVLGRGLIIDGPEREPGA